MKDLQCEVEEANSTRAEAVANAAILLVQESPIVCYFGT